MKKYISEKKAIRKIIAMGVIISLLICVLSNGYTFVFADEEKTESDDAIKTLSNGTVLMYEWKAVVGSDLNQQIYDFARSAKSRHVLLLKTDRKKYVSYYGSSDTMKLLGVNSAESYGECNVNTNYFISTTDMATPVMIGSGTQDPDFKYNITAGEKWIEEFHIGQYSKQNPKSAANRIIDSGEKMSSSVVMDTDGKTVVTDEEKAMYEAYKKNIGRTWSMAGGCILDEDGDEEYDIPDEEDISDVVKIWDTNPGGWTRDDGLFIDGDNVKCHRDADWDDYSNFYLWLGTELEFSAISQDYVIHSNEVAVIDGSKSNALLMKGHKIIIEEGGVLSIKGLFLNNGYIECNGGTIVLQENSVMAPYNTDSCPDINVDTGTITNGNGLLNIKGGEFFIMSNATLATDSKHYNAIRVVSDSNKRMGKIVNYGRIIAPSIYFKNALIYNKKSGVILLGLTFDNGIALKNTKISENNGVLSATYTTSTNKGNTFVMMSGNNSSALVNDGKFKFGSYPSGITFKGEGTYYK